VPSIAVGACVEPMFTEMVLPQLGGAPTVWSAVFFEAAMVAALARGDADLGDLPRRAGWQKIEPNPRVAAWIDDYSDIFGAILRKKLGR
jgi:hypothetical protein